MKRLVSFARLYRYFIFMIISGFISFPLLIIVYQQQPILYSNHLSNSSDNLQYEQYCQRINQRISVERVSKISIPLDPKYGLIPYSYSQWNSTPLIPRLLTPCEHAIYMDLLSILIERVFKKYNIQYMMMAATLLGSYTHHDILPWDDDVDLRVSISNRSNLQSIIFKELSFEPYSISLMIMYNSRNYDKIFFSWCPFAGEKLWRFPFIDIFYHDENSTHVWLIGEPSSCPVLREDIFPLVLRPLGPLWLYAPREPMAHFESRKMLQLETTCFTNPYSHKYERLMRNDILYINCTELQSIYPYVKRKCGSTSCTEYLKLGDSTIIHTLTYPYAYRTFLYAEMDQSYQAC